jgi:hypothetical protein
MRDKNHFLLSVSKSAVRMIGCLILVLSDDVVCTIYAHDRSQELMKILCKL